jgi:formylglycine-generating enzyme required for sulfatase activity
MIEIPAGPFSMGCNSTADPLCTDSATNDEKPQRTITVSAFHIDQTEVTQAAYAGCVNAGACATPSCNWDPAAHASDAVTCVTIGDAQAFCEYAGKRLPTEAQWEKAARGTDGRVYPWGNNAPSCDLANRGCGDTLSVGRLPAGASPYGVLDLAGNAAEIVSDFYDAYTAGPLTDPTGPSSGTTRVTRGGSRDSPDSILRTSSRQRIDPGQSSATIGFRCATSP